MKQIPFQTKMEVLDLYLQGLSADAVSEKTGVSKGAVISILKDARAGKYPQLELRGRIDELHNVAVRLRKQNLDLSQARLGFSFFQRLLAIGVEPERLEEWIAFCSEISPTSPEDFVPAAMELLKITRETGLSYTALSSEVTGLAEERQRLVEAVGDLQASEKRSNELKAEIGDHEKRLSELRAERSRLEAEVSSLNSVIQKRAQVLGIPATELEAKLGELVNLDDEIAVRIKECHRLQGEVKALTERHQMLASQMERASADFERDLKLIKQVRQEVAALAEVKGRYQEKVEHMEWAARVLPFLSDPDKVRDNDFSLISIVLNCVDKWIQLQPDWRFRWYSLRWDEIKNYVVSKRA
ncbi:MAG: hypothetical protein DRI01_07710 [Chloroflexi bacterium]|nr:MAG: hypothetical protein DRI01_07710 [Chloroflexota bacterium]